MACEDGTWVQVHTIRDGESQAQIMKCNGCAAWWVIIYPTRGRNDAFVIDQATDSEDAFRQAIAEKLAAR